MTLRTPVEVKLNAGWEFDSTRRAFVSDRGETFVPRERLPARSKIVHKTPALLAAAASRGKAKLSAAERNLLRYVQVILPAESSPPACVETIRQWPCVESATLPPEISLPDS